MDKDTPRNHFSLLFLRRHKNLEHRFHNISQLCYLYNPDGEQQSRFTQAAQRCCKVSNVYKQPFCLRGNFCIYSVKYDILISNTVQVYYAHKKNVRKL